MSEKHIDVSGYIVSTKETSLFMEKPIITPDEMDTPEQIFVIVPVKSNREAIIQCLADKNFQIMKDYFMLCVNQTVLFRGGYYEDVYGNKIISEVWNKDNVEVVIHFKGYGNQVVIGSGVVMAATTFTCEYGSKIIIRNKTKIEKTTLECIDNSFLEIGENCIIKEGIFSSCSSIIIGNKSTFEWGTTIRADFNSPITIGNDCMFSGPTYVHSNNSHALFDLEKKENTSLSKRHYIKIGNHVWVGKNAMIWFNSDIGNHCIVGAGSLVNKRFPEKCVIVGNPAKIVKRNYSWARKFKSSFEEFVQLEDGI